MVSVDCGSGDREDESLGVRELRVGEWRMNGRVERVDV